jgi:hypothetical protein
VPLRRAPPPLTSQPRAPPHPPRTPAPLPLLRPLVMGWGIPPLGGPALRRSPLPPPPTMSSPESPGGSPCCSRSRYSSSCCSRSSRRLFLFSPLRSAGGRLGPGRRWIRSCGTHGHRLLKTIVKTASVCLERTRSLLTAGASGSITNDQRSSLSCHTDLRLMARLALVAAYSEEGVRAVDANAPTP